MRKLLTGILLTLRWLLVPLLPLLGLAVGVIIMPEAKPRWNVPMGEKSHCLGMITDHDQPFLLFDQGLSLFAKAPQIEVMDLTTGETSIKRAEDENDLSELARVPSTTLALRHKTIGVHPAFRLYDWEKHLDVHQGFLPDANPYLESLTFHGHTLAAAVSVPRSTVEFWHFDEYQPTDPVVVSFPRGYRFDIQMSADEATAIVRYLVRPVDGSSASIFHVKVIDTLQGKIVQDMSSKHIVAVRWHPVDNSFLALQEDDTAQQLFWQRYSLVDNSFTPSGPKVLLNKNSRLLSPSPGPFIVLESINIDDLLRRKVLKLLGQEGQSVLNRIWPLATTVELYQTSNGELLQSITLPYVDDRFSDIKTAYPDPNGQGVVLKQLQHYSYWEFNRTSRWYPRLGLALGIVLAILLAWLNLRRWKRVRA